MLYLSLGTPTTIIIQCSHRNALIWLHNPVIRLKDADRMAYSVNPDPKEADCWLRPTILPQFTVKTLNIVTVSVTIFRAFTVNCFLIGNVKLLKFHSNGWI